eukprot:scaffold81722_cov22-Cyclotella_meneghiniana.AAC.1
MPITQQTNDSDGIVKLTQENAKSHAAMNDYNSKNEIVNERRNGMIDAQQEKITPMSCASESGSVICAREASSKRRHEKHSRTTKKHEPSRGPDDIDVIDLTEEPQMPSITQQTNDCDGIIDLTQE